jgi:hypothetical protein
MDLFLIFFLCSSFFLKPDSGSAALHVFRPKLDVYPENGFRADDSFHLLISGLKPGANHRWLNTTIIFWEAMNSNGIYAVGKMG